MSSLTPSPSQPAIETGSVALLLMSTLAASLLIQAATDLRQAVLFILGVGFGITLMHALFGFSGGWRRFIRQRDSRSVRAQLLLFMLTALLFFPLLGGVFPGLHLSGAVSPAGVSVLVGAFMFGIGMQLGGGCGSGTLYTMGQGQFDMLLTLVFFVIGATVASSQMTWWQGQGDLGTISLIKEYGWFTALLMTLATLIALYVLAAFFDKQKNQHLQVLFSPVSRDAIIPTLVFGRWPLWWAVIALTLLSVCTLILAGHPWSITFAFSLWGTKIWAALGGDISQWSYWQLPYPASALNSSVLLDTTSVMDLGLILGAAIAAALAGRFAPAMKISANKLLAVIVGGLLLGYGARLAYGCNIGALFAGIASGSLHGWLWLLTGFAGNIVGSRLRYVIKLDKA